MNLTPISFHTRPYQAAGPFDDPPLSIGCDVEFVGVIQTDVTVSYGVGALAGSLYCVLEMFKPVSSPPIPLAAPSAPYFVLAISTSTPTGVSIPTAFVGANSRFNGEVSVEIDDTGTDFRFIVRGVFTLLEDNENTSWDNSRRLLYSHINSTTLLANVVASYYNTTRLFRVAVRHEDQSNNVVGADLTLNNTARWYNKDVFNAVPTHVTNFGLTLKVGGIPVNQVSALEKTYAEVTFDTPHIVSGMLVGLIRVNAATPAAKWYESYEARYAFITPVATPTFLSAYRGPAAFRGPSNPPTPTTPPTHLSTFFIDPSAVTVGGVYRLVFVVYFNSPSFAEDTYSFISDELTVLDTPAICPPSVNARLLDYRTAHPSIVTGAAGYERMIARTLWDGPSYANCRATRGYPESLQDALQRITVRLYESTPTGKRVYAEGAGVKTGIALIEGPNVRAEWASNRWNANFKFRVRWEANVPNLYDLDANDNILPPTGTQDWAGKTFEIEWILRLRHTTPRVYEDELRLVQHLSVSSRSVCYSFAYQTPNGTPVRLLCQGAGVVRAVVTACGPVSAEDRLLWFVLPENYALNSVSEFESWTGLAPPFVQLANAPILTASSTWDVNNQAVADIDTNLLTPLVKYRIVLVVKREPYGGESPCVDCFEYVGLPLSGVLINTVYDCFIFDLGANHF